jgi:hypothetical protein
MINSLLFEVERDAGERREWDESKKAPKERKEEEGDNR